MLRQILLATVCAVGVSANAADTYKIDASHTSVLFKINHLGFSHVYGKIRDVSGQFVVDDAKAENSSLELVMKVASINTDDEKRDAHLKKADFFNVKQFPEIKFKSTAVTKTSGTYRIDGELEMMGQKKPVKIDFIRLNTGKDPWGGTRTGGDFTFKIKRSEFKMTFMNGPLGDDVEVFGSVEGIKQ